MIINVADLLEKKVLKKDIEYTFSKKSLDGSRENVEFTQPIFVKGIMKSLNDIILFDGYFDTEVLLTCSRCLEDFKYKLKVKVCEKFSNNNIGDFDTTYIDDNNIDLDGIIISDIIMALPMKPLCKPDCKGLCQVCGTNLNYHQCSCKQDNSDSSLLKLKDFFSSK